MSSYLNDLYGDHFVIQQRVALRPILAGDLVSTADARPPTPAELAYYDQQRELAATGQALNQCPHCGSYRIDGSTSRCS
jgi:hypothetical protein